MNASESPQCPEGHYNDSQVADAARGGRLNPPNARKGITTPLTGSTGPLPVRGLNPPNARKGITTDLEMAAGCVHISLNPPNARKGITTQEHGDAGLHRNRDRSSIRLNPPNARKGITTL